MGRGRSSSSGRGSSSSRGSSFSRGSSRSSSGSSWSSSRSGGRTVIWHTSSHNGNGSFTLLPIAIFLIAIGAVALFIIVPSMFTGFKYAEVSARCIKNEEYSGWYYTTYEYEIDGVEYTSESQEGWEFPEVIGKNVTIYYLKDDPSIITEENPGFTSADLPILACGVVFVGAGIGLIFLNKKLKAKQASQQLSESNTSISIENNQPKAQVAEKTKCSYCGCKYDASLDSCPNCGASNKN